MQTSMEKKTIDCLHFIDGQYVPSDNGKTFVNINPVTA